MTVRLPIFQGYTVDVRLKEFRKANPNKGLEFVKFDSSEGETLLEWFIKTLNPKNKNDHQTLLDIGS